jgi:glycerate 2-kinase
LTTLAQSALRIFRAAVKAADPADSVKRRLQDIGDYRSIYVVGAGKAAVAMARAAEQVLGSRIRAGFVNTKYGHGGKLRRIEVQECGHPIPDENGLRGARKIAEIARAAGPNDLVLCLISGGASALVPFPSEGISLAQKQRAAGRLLACGASIHEFNCVRKHMSRIKGGQLARLAFPAHVRTLILSDVIGDDLDVIGSGPTVPDRSTLADAQTILDKYGIGAKLGAETPKPGDPIFQNVENILVGSNRQAVEAGASKARELGFDTLILSTEIQGEAREIARVHAAIAKEMSRARRPMCVISGGEPTVTVRGSGLGGRNQEFVLGAALDIAGLKNVLVFSAGTDGTDGPTDAAGAYATGETGLHPNAGSALANNDSYHFFEEAGGLVKTGPTGTNVMDIQIVLAKPVAS